MCSALPLPEHGMTVNLSRITTGSSVAAQNGENTAVSETEMDDTLLTIDVRTIAGQQNISRQLFERSQPDIDMVIFRDLAAAYAAELNRQCITGTGINGELRGVLNTSGIESVTYTDASPTVGSCTRSWLMLCSVCSPTSTGVLPTS
ncbi:MAG: phage major capsid protein [Microthrixaceae bacterium]|nr:phage major capsid protein [Microthrixaceae bacterium]